MTASLSGTYTPAYNRDIPSINVELFSSNVFQVAEQKESRLMSLFPMRESLDGGQSKFIDILDDLEGHDISGAAETDDPPWSDPTAGGTQTGEIGAQNRYELTKWRYPTWQQRLLIPEEWRWAVPIERNDYRRINVDIDSQYVRKAAASFARRLDRIIYTALGENVTQYYKATTNTTSRSSETKALSDSQPDGTDSTIEDNSEGLTITKLMEADQRLTNREVPDTGRYIIATANQKRDLLNDAKIQSIDYNAVRALVNGEINTYMGFDFIWFGSKHSIITGTGSPVVRQCFACHSDAITIGMEEQMFQSVDTRTDYNYLKQIYMAISIGAIRMSEEHLVRIDCVES